MKSAPRLLLLSAFLVALIVAAPAARADTVYLKNGNRIDGQVIEGGGPDDSQVVLQIANAGRMTLRAGEVLKIERGAAKAGGEGAAGDHVAVVLKSSGDYYGKGTYYGQVLPESDDRTLVLGIPGPGKIRIEKSGIASQTKIDAPRAAAEAAPSEGGARSIKTTHAVHLKNGRRITGNLLESPENEPLKLKVGDQGVVFIARDTVERTEAVEGQIDIPAPPAAAEAAPPPEHAETTEELRTRLKREARAEVLHELIDAVIEERLQSAAHGRRFESALDEELVAGLSNDDILAIQDEVRELGRQRNTNRVRAERHLKDAGSAALPFLRGAVEHPFELTRRAVQRIVRDIGDPRGAPLAIAALNDPDEFVRQHAGEALAKLFPDARIRYNPDANEDELLHAQEEYWGLWDELVRAEARRSVLEALARNRPY